MTFLDLRVSGGIWLGQLTVYLLLACSLGGRGQSHSSDRACARDQLVRLRAHAMAGHTNGPGEPFTEAFYLVTNLPVGGSLLRGGFGFSPSSDGVLFEDCCSCWERSRISHSLCSLEKGASERSRFLAIALASSVSLIRLHTTLDAEKDGVVHRGRPSNSHLRKHAADVTAHALLSLWLPPLSVWLNKMRL